MSLKKVDVESLKEVKPKPYVDHYKCWPLPLFIIVTSVLQVLGFFYYSMDPLGDNRDNLVNSTLIYRPDKRLQLWRYASYALLHAGWIHLAFNTLVQVLVGLPLEMVHGSLRVGCLYLAGVLAGSLGTSVFDSEVYLVGASGGVYALLAAHLANVLINYNIMQFACLRLVAVAFVAATDMGFALYDYFTGVMVGLPVSYIAHLTGALSGVTLGLAILKSFKKDSLEQILRWLGLGIYLACIVFAVIYNILHPYPYVGFGQISM
ncbi:unnamed protein product, partial [Meganyctiphanes norvegica]